MTRRRVPGFHIFLMAALAFFAGPRAAAFALLGPLDSTFQTTTIGYGLPSDIGGPMNLGEGYRWNVPVITYGFDQTFLDSFGPYGVNAVERAIRVLNDLPAVDAITNGIDGDQNIYLSGVAVPARTKSLNFQAQALGALDLKSETLALLMEQMGLAQPDRYVWCLRQRTVLPGGAPTNYVAIQRNFDPITGTASSSVNGTLYTYHIEDTTGQPYGYADAVEDLVDPLSPALTSVASQSLNAGEFYRGMTRDDLAGLRYLLSTNRTAVESLLPGVTGAGANSSNFINTAARPGVGKITFMRMNLDPTSRQFIAVTNRYVDTYIGAGNIPVQQSLERVIVRPDILFAAQDLGIDMYQRTGTTNWANNAGLNSLVATAGPGVIRPPIVIGFNNSGPFIINQAPSFLNQGNGFAGLEWASFDETTNEPVVLQSTLVPSPPITTANGGQALNNGQFSLQIGSRAFLTYSIQGSADLVNWSTLTNIDSTASSIQYADPATTNLIHRFYRVIIPW